MTKNLKMFLVKHTVKKSVMAVLIWILIAFVPAEIFGQENTSIGFYEKANRHSSHGEFREAIYYYRKSLEKNPAYLAAHYGAALAYFSLSDFGRSISHFKKVLELDPTNADAHTWIAIVYMQLGQYEQALKNLEYVKSTDPGNIANNHAFGVYYFHQKKYELARSYFEKTIRLSPRFIQSLIGLARVQFVYGRNAEALKLLEKASAINPEHFEIQLLKGELYLAQALEENDLVLKDSWFEKSSNSFLSAQKLNDEHQSVQFQLILLDLYSQNPASAYQRSRELLKKHVSNNQALYLHAVLALYNGDLATAVDTLNKAVYNDPQDSVMRYRLENILLDSAGTYISMKNILANYHEDRARVYRSENNFDLFLDHLNRALLLNPACSACLDSILEYSRARYDLHSYIKILQRMRRSDSNNAKINFRLERALEKTRNGLAYRKQLFNQYERPGQNNYNKTPDYIFLFDPDIKQQLNYHVDLPALISEALAQKLDDQGSIQSVPANYRKNILNILAKNNKTKYALPFYHLYRPEYIRHIENLEQDHSIQIEYLLIGEIQSDHKIISYKASIIEKQTATQLATNNFRVSGRDAFTTLVLEMTNWIRDVLPVRGRIIRIDLNEIYLNIGNQEGVQKNDRLAIYRNKDYKGELEVLESDSSISRARLLNGSIDKLDLQDMVIKKARSK